MHRASSLPVFQGMVIRPAMKVVFYKETKLRFSQPEKYRHQGTIKYEVCLMARKCEYYMLLLGRAAKGELHLLRTSSVISRDN